ncbi:MAG: transcription repressor NadR [Clostridiales bacterium]|nr:transcription repressor NadR [Clostridiales bacterium]
MTKQSKATKEYSSEERRRFIKRELQEAREPLSASYFAGKLSVSRQIIVGDVAILRASGLDVLAASRGYLLNDAVKSQFPFVDILTCIHSSEQLKEELYTIVDYGATVIDVIIEHAVYGEISGKLDLSSRYDVDLFLKTVEEEKNAAPISSLTGGIHIHTIGCKEKATFDMIKAALVAKGIAME